MSAAARQARIVCGKVGALTILAVLLVVSSLSVANGQPNQPTAAISTRSGTVQLVPAGLVNSAIQLGGPAALGKHPSLPLLYAAPEWGKKNGRLFTIRYDRRKLRVVQEVRIGGAGAVHIAVSDDAKSLLVSQYTSGSLAFVSLDANGLPQSVRSRPLRPGAKAHAAVFVGGEVLVTDLGNSRIELFTTGADTVGSLAFPGDGPRSLVVLDSQRVVVSNELSDSVTCLSKELGEWKEKSRVSLSLSGRSVGKPADVVRLASDVVAVADRGPNEVIELSAKDCVLTIVKRYGSGGVSPRVLVPSGGRVFVGHEQGASESASKVVASSGSPDSPIVPLTSQAIQSAVALG